MTTLLGPFVTSADIRAAFLDHLRLWQATYLAEAERAGGREARSLPLIRGWELPDEISKWPETQLPALVVFVGDSSAAPRVEGDGTVTVRRSVEVTAVCAARGDAESRDFASIYAFSAAAAVMQNPSIGGIAESTEWVRVGTQTLSTDKQRTLAAEGNVFDVTFSAVMNRHAGFAAPPEDPYDVPAFPTIDETHVEVSKP